MKCFKIFSSAKNKKFICLFFFLFGVLFFNYCFEINFIKQSIPENYLFQEKENLIKDLRIGIIVQKSTLGEKELAQRFKLTIDSMGGKSYVFQYKGSLGRFQITSWAVQKLNDIVNYFFQPEFLIVLTPSYYPILTLSIPKYYFTPVDIETRMESIMKHKINNNPQFIDYNDYLGDYDGFINATDDSSWLKNNDMTLFTREKKYKNYLSINGFYSAYSTKFTQSNYNQLFYCGGNWDELRASDFYTNFIKILETKGYLNVYGPAEKWKYLKSSYKGFLPFDGKSIINKINELGVTLVLHSNIHNDYSVPSSRIFEAAAAGSVIISDENAFVKKEFGNCVLFIDFSKSASEVAQQIDNYMQWIEKNPEQALIKAKCAHETFLKKFTIEHFITNLIDKHEDLIKHENLYKLNAN